MSKSLRPPGLHSPWNYLGQNAGVGILSLLQRIFQTQGLYSGLWHCKQILYQLSHKGSSFLSDQYKELEENNRIGKTRDLFKKIRDTKGTFHVKMGP